MLEGIRRDNEQIEKIINNPEKPTFDNTIISVDDEKDGQGYYNLLSRVSNVFFNLLSAETCDEMDALAQKMSPILTKHANDIRLNERLFERIKYVHRHHRKLSPEEKMLLDNCYDGFVRSGALLDAEGKERLRQLTEEASMLGLQFSQNLLKENKAFTLHITEEADLDGLPESAREAAAQTAREQEKEVGSDSDGFDEFSALQFERFTKGADALQEAYPNHHILRHMCNSAAIEHFPERQMDMVRLGLGLYGINSRNNEIINNVSTLKTTILQIHDVPKEETVGYSRKGRLKRDSRIAVLPIGYADVHTQTRLTGTVPMRYGNAYLLERRIRTRIQISS